MCISNGTIISLNRDNLYITFNRCSVTNLADSFGLGNNEIQLFTKFDYLQESIILCFLLEIINNTTKVLDVKHLCLNDDEHTGIFFDPRSCVLSNNIINTNINLLDLLILPSYVPPSSGKFNLIMFKINIMIKGKSIKDIKYDSLIEENEFLSLNKNQ